MEECNQYIFTVMGRTYTVAAPSKIDAERALESLMERKAKAMIRKKVSWFGRIFCARWVRSKHRAMDKIKSGI